MSGRYLPALLVVVVSVAQIISADGISQWTLESLYPPEFSSPRVVLIDNIAYLFSDGYKDHFSRSLNSIEVMDRMWMFDTNSTEWSTTTLTGNIPPVRADYCIASIRNDIYLFGGQDPDTGNFLRDFFQIDVTTRSWTRLQDGLTQPPERSEHSCFSWNKRFYVYGGSQDAGLNDMWEYSFDKQVWRIVQPTGNAPYRTGVYGTLDGDKFYVFGGGNQEYRSQDCSIWIFDLSARVWREETIVEDCQPLYEAGITIWNQKIFRFGGMTTSGEPTSRLTIINLEKQPDSGQKNEEITASLSSYPILKPSPRYGCAIFSTAEKIFIFGGVGDDASNDWWAFDPVSQEWVDSSLSRYPLPRKSARGISISRNQFLLFGGRVNLMNGGERSINDLWKYDADDGSWTRLYQEFDCPSSNSSCGPLVLNPATAYYDGKLFVTGSSDESKEAKVLISSIFSFETKVWSAMSIVDSSQASFQSLLQTFAFASHSNLLYIWKGTTPGSSNVEQMSSVYRIDLNTHNITAFSSNMDAQKGRVGATGFIWNSQFCVYGGTVNKPVISPAISCHVDNTSTWQDLIDKSIRPRPNLQGRVEILGALLAFGGVSISRDRRYSSTFFDDRWNNAATRDYWPLGIFEHSSAMLGSKVYIFGGVQGLLSNMTSLLYSFDFANIFCARTDVLRGEFGVLTDGSGRFLYYPGTSCEWEVRGPNYIQLNNIQLEQNATLMIEPSSSECNRLLIDQVEYLQFNITNESTGTLVHIPSAKFRVVFNAALMAKPGRGFEMSYFTCQKGFYANGTECICNQDKFINFRGECIQCPPGEVRSTEDDSICMLNQNSKVQLEVDVSRSFNEKATPGLMQQISYGLPAFARGGALFVNQEIFILGGRVSNGNSMRDYQSMDILYSTNQTVLSEWKETTTTGDIPTPRWRHCVVAIDSVVVLIGGETVDQDPHVYHLDVKTFVWTRKGRAPVERIGAICVGHDQHVIYYGGRNALGTVENDAWKYEPANDQWTLTSKAEANPRIALAQAIVFESKLFVMSGTNGREEHNAVHVVDVDSMSEWSRIGLELEACAQCDNDDTPCNLGRQEFSMGFYNSTLHIFGGRSKGRALQDVFIFSLSTSQVVYHYNYEWQIPTLPLQYPPPKYGAASVSVGDSVIMIGGIGGGGLATSDTWTWNMDLQTWSDTSITRIPIGRGMPGITKTGDKTFVIFGGWTWSSEEILLNDMWQFNIVSRKWQLLFRDREFHGEDDLNPDAHFPAGRAEAGMGYSDGQIFVMGGRTHVDIADKRLWIFSLDEFPERASWKSIDIGDVGRNFRPLHRVGAMSVWSGSDFIVYGGQLYNNLRGGEKYTPILLFSTESQRATPIVPEGRRPANRKYSVVHIIDQNTMFLYGGAAFDGQIYNDAWVLNLEENTWTEIFMNKTYDVHSGASHSTVFNYGNTTFIHGGYGQAGIRDDGFMYQHDYGAQVRLHIESEGKNAQLAQHSTVVFGDEAYIVGGTSGFSLSSYIYVYRPALCDFGGKALLSTFDVQEFDDGSANGMYLSNTDCSWTLSGATDLLLLHSLRKDDVLQVVFHEGSNDEASKRSTTLYARGGSINNMVHFRGRGNFSVSLQAASYRENLSTPCEGCHGFRVLFAACPEHGVLSATTRKCECEAGYNMIDRMCVAGLPDITEQIGNDSAEVVTVSSVGGVLGFVLVAVVYCSIRYRNKAMREAAKVNRKLYGSIAYTELQFAEVIGFGSFGEVYRGEWRGTEVAIKKLLPSVFAQGGLEDFKREIAVYVELRHPNIVLYMGACFDVKNTCVVTELMQHGTLLDVLGDQAVTINSSTQLRFMTDIAKGMVYLHSSRPPILHRDLKSPNILVDDRMRLKVSDFGMTEFQDGQTLGSKPGSLLWLAPEIISDSLYTVKADVYSFAIIMWEILTRNQPYADLESIIAVAIRVTDENLRPTLPESADGPLIDMIRNAWDAKPDNRPSFEELLKKINALADSAVSFSTHSSMNSIGQPQAPSQEKVAVVNTRVEAAERLWEDIPDAMCEALLLHNDIVRMMTHQTKGYISQNDADGYIIVFSDVVDAMRFCVSSQERLQNAGWSEKILKHPCSESVLDGNLRGLRVRMAIHFGSCNQYMENEWGRVHFSGKTIIDCCRLNGLAKGGQTLISHEAAMALDESAKGELGDMFYQSTNTTQGLENEAPFKLQEVLSPNLRERAKQFAGHSHATEQHTPILHVDPQEDDAFSHTALEEHHPSSPAPMTKNNNRDPAVLMSLGQSEMMSGFSAERLPKPMHRQRPPRKTPLRNALSWEIDLKDIGLEAQSLGAGSFGTVYPGHYKGSRVAVKKIVSRSNNEQHVLSLIAEINILRSLRHENIVEFIGACMNSPDFALVMELVEPGSLKSLLHQSQKLLTEPEKKRIIYGIVSAMEYLHSREPPIIHRDLKPANILVNDKMVAKICDFGFARVKTHNRTMTQCGTLSYQAPEVMRGQRYSEKADVYSFGIVLYEIEARQTPYPELDVAGIQRVAKEGLRPQLYPGMKEQYVGLMQQCWDGKDDRRPSFHELKVKLSPSEDH